MPGKRSSSREIGGYIMNSSSCILAALVLCFASDARAQGKCPYLPEFSALQTQIKNITAPNAVIALEKYLAAHENGQACELVEIDRLLSIKEIALIKLTAANSEIHPHSVYRCNEFNPKTAQCQSPMEDGTAHPMSAGITFTPVAAPRTAMRIVSSLPTAQLIGLYQTTLTSALDGKAAKRLPHSATVYWKTRHQESILIAIYKTTGPWAYRKAVWYFQ